MLLTAIVVIGVGTYAVLQRENTSVYSFPLFKKIVESPLFKKLKLSDSVQSFEKGDIARFATTTVERGTETVRMQIGALSDTVAEKTESILDKLVNGITSTTFLTVKNSVDTQLNKIGTNFGVDVNQLSANSPIVFGVVVDTPAYFTITNSNKDEASYTVEWQDGTQDNGTIESKKTRTVTHTWKKSGIYAVQFKITVSNVEQGHQIIISIL